VNGMQFRVALLQLAPAGNDQNKNFEKGVQACRDAKALGADLAVFPELWNIGFSPHPFDAEGQRRWTASAIGRESDFFQGFGELPRASCRWPVAGVRLRALEPREVRPHPHRERRTARADPGRLL